MFDSSSDSDSDSDAETQACLQMCEHMIALSDFKSQAEKARAASMSRGDVLERLGLAEATTDDELLFELNRQARHITSLQRLQALKTRTAKQQGDIAEHYVACTRKRHYMRADGNSMHYLRPRLVAACNRALSSMADITGNDIVVVRDAPGGGGLTLSGVREVKNLTRTKLTADMANAKGARFMRRSNGMRGLGEVDFGFVVSASTLTAVDYTGMLEQTVEMFSAAEAWEGTTVTLTATTVVDLTDESQFLLSLAEIDACRKQLAAAAAAATPAYMRRPWVDSALLAAATLRDEAEPLSAKGSTSYSSLAPHMLHVNATTGAGKTAASVELARAFGGRRLVLLSKHGDLDHFCHELRRVYGDAAYRLLRLQHITDRSTRVDPEAQFVFTTLHCCNAEAFAGATFDVGIIDEAHHMESYVERAGDDDRYRGDALRLLADHCNYAVALTATPNLQMMATVPEAQVVRVTHSELVASGHNVPLQGATLYVSSAPRISRYQIARHVVESGIEVTLVVGQSRAECRDFAAHVERLGTRVYRRFGGQQASQHDDLPANFKQKSVIVTITEDVAATDRPQIGSTVHINEPTETCSARLHAQAAGRCVRPHPGKLFGLVVYPTVSLGRISAGVQRAFAAIALYAGLASINDLQIQAMISTARATVVPASRKRNADGGGGGGAAEAAADNGDVRPDADAATPMDALETAEAAVLELPSAIGAIWSKVRSELTVRHRPPLTDEEKEERRKRREAERAVIDERKEARAGSVQARLVACREYLQQHPDEVHIPQSYVTVGTGLRLGQFVDMFKSQGCNKAAVDAFLALHADAPDHRRMKELFYPPVKLTAHDITVKWAADNPGRLPVYSAADACEMTAARYITKNKLTNPNTALPAAFATWVPLVEYRAGMAAINALRGGVAGMNAKAKTVLLDYLRWQSDGGSESSVWGMSQSANRTIHELCYAATKQQQVRAVIFSNQDTFATFLRDHDAAAACKKPSKCFLCMRSRHE